MTNLLLLDPRNVYTDEPRPFVVWGIQDGIRYQDLDPLHYDEALDYIKDEYMQSQVLFKQHNLSDNYEEYFGQIKSLISAKCSIIAIDIETEKIIGLVVMYPMSSSNFTWQYIRMRKFKSSFIQHFFRLLAELVITSEELEQNYDTSYVLHYFILSSARAYKGKSLNESLLLHAYKVARSMGIPTITYASTSKNGQERAKRTGMICVNTIPYQNYLDENKQQIFNNLGSSQFAARLFASKVGKQAHMGYLENE